MGIRESLEKVDEQNLNLKDLNLEQEENQESDFDVEKEAEKQFENIKLDLDNYRNVHDWENFLMLAYQIKIIYPDKIQELNLNQEALEEVLKVLETTLNRDYLLQRCAEVKILFPDYDGLYLEEIWEQFQENLRETKKADLNQESLTGIEALINRIYNGKILFSNRFSGLDFDFNRKERQTIARKLRQESKLQYFLQSVSKLKVIFPDLDLQNIGINEKFWEKVKKEFDSKKNHGEHHNCAVILSCCKIILAEEVKITDQGLELVMPEKKFKPEKLQRPERREH